MLDKLLATATTLRVSLNARQQKFVQEYLKSGNKTQAAIAAGYSERNAESIGCRLSRHVKVRAEIERVNEVLTQAGEISVERLRAELAKPAFAEIPLSKLSWPDKLKASEMLGRSFGMFQDANAGAAMAFQINIHLGASDG